MGRNYGMGGVEGFSFDSNSIWGCGGDRLISTYFESGG